MVSCSEEKKNLVERLGIQFERELNITPLAARILALLILTPSEGLTFDEITQITGASKSSISTNVNLLLQLKTIDYFTKPGDRKRYFKVTSNYLEINLNENLLKVNRELEIIDSIDQFNRKYEDNQSEKRKIRQLYQEYLRSQQENLKETIKKISKI
ncbi:GbsR/MarR family transcriptional regulator [Mesonia sp. HuA40]|uniref:GbsR/MarR family transcriptional regulator n=1 Tax=Mesonia sp. HuA40 TaxID=2602761 RepID=UPI0011CB5F34|nr:MarR family transcriptional regulator [Mesonia sp. HuA40]TXK72601.1 transcriptional regulator [Mesonia sp. HuA40]